MKNAKRILNNFIVIFFVVLISANTLASILLYDQIYSIRSEIEELQDKVYTIEIEGIREATLSEQKIIDFYREINNKMDEAVNRILTIVGIVAGIVTFFSLLLTFKAPHDLDKRIEKLNDVINRTKESAEEAKYQALISSALAQENKYTSIKKLREIIHKYPEKPDAFLMRGTLYDEIKKYDFAINDYKMAKKLKCDISSYYNNMGVTYSNKGDNRKAIEFYTQAIKVDKDDSSYYCNRACSYDELGRFDKALNDFEKAIEINNECYEAYYNRNFTYDKLWRTEENDVKRNEYIQCRKADLEKAIDLNPEDDNARKLLKKFIEELIEEEIIPSQRAIIAELDENIGDINMKNGATLEAFEHYLDAFNYHARMTYQHNKKEHENDVDRICLKISEAILNKKESDNIDINKKSVPILVAKIRSLGIQFYQDGDKSNAEKLFLSLLPDEVAALNLAFMCRRQETKLVEESTIELLNMYNKKGSAIWCINKALCYIDGITEENQWYKAIEIVKEAEEDIEQAVEWWSDESIIGSKENNVVLLLLQLAGKYDDSKDIIERINKAERDGYIIPDELKNVD